MVKFGKKGSVAVLITLIFSSLTMGIAVIGECATERLKADCADGAVTLACRSVLSEYDIRLLEDYGIFAYKDTAEAVEKKLELYVRANMNNSFLPLNADDVAMTVRSEEYSLYEPDVLEEQLLKAGAEKAVLGGGGVRRASMAEPKLKIENEAMTAALPSAGKPTQLLNTDLFSGEESLLNKAGSSYLLTQYIMNTFNSGFTDHPDRQSFFNYEVEYILSGKKSEEESLDYVKRRLAAVRMSLNTAHILASPAKMKEVTAYVAAIPTGAEPIEAAVIIALWAGAETDNDISLLMDGKNVAFAKTELQWAVPFKTALGSIFAKGYIEPADTRGQSYEDYLEAFLYIQDKQTKLLRIMDLIQINLRRSYNGSFLIKEHYTGFRVQAAIDGREYEYAHNY